MIQSCAKFHVFGGGTGHNGLLALELVDQMVPNCEEDYVKVKGEINKFTCIMFF